MINNIKQKKENTMNNKNLRTLERVTRQLKSFEEVA